MYKVRSLIYFAPLLVMFYFNPSLNAMDLQPQRTNVKKENIMAQAQTKKIIDDFYKYFNAAQLDHLFLLISDDLSYEINYNGRQKGKQNYI